MQHLKCFLSMKIKTASMKSILTSPSEFPSLHPEQRNEVIRCTSMEVLSQVNNLDAKGTRDQIFQLCLL